MTALEERLATELREESETITPASLADLRLPQRAGPAGWSRRMLRGRGTQHWYTKHWQQWGKPLAAAAAVTAVIAGTIAVVHAIPGPPSLPTAAASYQGAPASYAYHTTAADGRDAIDVRSTATGKLLAALRAPRTYAFTALTAAANGSLFAYLTVNALPRRSSAPVTLTMLWVTSRGSVRLIPLPLPETVTGEEDPSIALSPDGSKLALAFASGQTPVVQVITLATGSTLQWTAPGATWLPIIRGEGAWTADGRTVAVGQDGLLTFQPIAPGRDPVLEPAVGVVRLFSIVGQGTRLVQGKPLALNPGAGQQLGGEVFLTPDGKELIEPTLANMYRTTNTPWPGHLSVYSTRTGVLLTTMGAWAWTWTRATIGLAVFPYQIVAWSSRSGSQLIMLQPSDDQNRLEVLREWAYTPGRAGRPASVYTPSPDGAGLPPQGSAAYRTLEDALRVSPQLVW